MLPPAGTRSATVVDSERVVLVHRPGRPPTYAFPPGDVAGDVAGEAAGALAEPDPDAPGYVRVPWDALDAWFEEDERVSGHPRNPYHRIECVRTSRRLRVEVAGVVLVDTTTTMGVYETALEPRLYVARDEVRMDLLVAGATRGAGRGIMRGPAPSPGPPGRPRRARLRRRPPLAAAGGRRSSD